MPLVSFSIETDMVTQRTLNNIVRDANRATMRYHGLQRLRQHFEAGAAFRYGYDRRRSKYVKSMRRRFPNWRPLVATGLLKDHVLNPANIESGLTATRSRGRLRIKPGHAIRSQQRSEIERMDRKDVGALTDFWERYTHRAINDPKNRTKRKRGTKSSA